MRLDTSCIHQEGILKGNVSNKPALFALMVHRRLHYAIADMYTRNLYEGSVRFKTIFHIPIFQFYEHCKLEMQTNNIKRARGVPRKPARGSTLLGVFMPVHLVREWFFLIFIDTDFVHLVTSIHLMLHRRSSIAFNAITTNSTITKHSKNLFQIEPTTYLDWEWQMMTLL